MTGPTARLLIPGRKHGGGTLGSISTRPVSALIIKVGVGAVLEAMLVSLLMAFLSAGFILPGIAQRHAETAKTAGEKSASLRTHGAN